MVQISADIPASLKAALEEKSQRSSGGVSSIITAALARYLKKPIHTIFQVSTSGALVAGVYAREVNVQTLLEHGDFGLGTFADLDGEMVVVDGRAYQIQGSGRVSEASPDAGAPFAVVTQFEASIDVSIGPVRSVKDLEVSCDPFRSSGNLFYALRLDDQSFMADAAERFAPIASMSDRVARGQGIETLVSASRGALFNVVGTGEAMFERIGAELSGYYLLGVESGPTDKDGKTHPIRVDVNRKGVTVRSRRAIINTAEIRKPRTARESIISALETPLPLSALPIRVATYSLQGPETDKVQILIHADVGSDYSASRVVSLGYVITDESGRMVDSQMANARLQPVMNGVPSALQYAGGASLPPGDYTLKLAVAEGDRIGTV